MHSQCINSTVLHTRQLFCTESGGRRFEHLGQTSHYPQNILIMRQMPRNVDQASQTWHSICHARSISRQARMPSSAPLGQRHSETCKIADFRAFRSIYHSKWGKHRPRESLAHTRPTTSHPSSSEQESACRSLEFLVASANRCLQNEKPARAGFAVSLQELTSTQETARVEHATSTHSLTNKDLANAVLVMCCDLPTSHIKLQPWRLVFCALNGIPSPMSQWYDRYMSACTDFRA